MGEWASHNEPVSAVVSGDQRKLRLTQRTRCKGNETWSKNHSAKGTHRIAWKKAAVGNAFLSVLSLLPLLILVRFPPAFNLLFATVSTNPLLLLCSFQFPPCIQCYLQTPLPPGQALKSTWSPCSANFI